MVRMKAQLTVLAGMIIVLVMSLICTTIRSASDAVLMAKADMASGLSLESVFANYSRPLADRFNILLLPSSEHIEGSMLDIASFNCNGGTDNLGVKAISAQIKDFTAPTDEGGVPFATGVVEYMNYGVFSELSRTLMGYDKQRRREEKAKEIINEIADCEEDIREIDEQLLKVIAMVEGIQTKEGYIDGMNNQPVPTYMAFVKECCPGRITMNNVAVNDNRVFGSMQNQYTDMMQLIDDIIDDADELNDADDDTAESRIRWLQASLNSEISEFSQIVSGCREQCEYAIDACTIYLKAQKTIESKADSTQRKIKASEAVLGDELSRGLSEDAQKIRRFETKDAICDALIVNIQLKDILPYFIKLEEYADSLYECNDRGDYTGVSNEAGNAVSAAGAVNYEGLEFNYSNVDFSGRKSDDKMMDKLKQTLKNGIMSLVVEDLSQISDKKIEFDNLAVEHYNKLPSHSDGLLCDMKNRLLYDEYVMTEFADYMDSFEKGEHKATQDYLEYQIEYILNGAVSDYDNLFRTVVALSGLREAANICCLFTDAARKKECYILSMSLFGFTGMPALVTIGQYAIMAVWAYAESLVEVRNLLKGGTAQLIKTPDKWQLGLENMLALKFGDSDASDNNGLKYEEFLRVLLFCEQDSAKYFRTMAQIELWMIKNGFEQFRMHNQIYAISADYTFQIPGRRQGDYYVRNISYNY